MARRYAEKSITIAIDGSWSAAEFALLMRSLDDVYNLASLLTVRGDHHRPQLFPLDRRTIRRLAVLDADILPLMVARVSYGSPGIIDLIGVGKSLEHIKDFILGIVDRFLDAKQRRLHNEAASIANKKALAEINEAEQKAVSERAFERKMQVLSVNRRELENLRLAEEIRTLVLNNVQAETTFSHSFSKMLQANGLTSDEQSSMVHWVGTRAQPLEELARGGKLIGVRDESKPTE